MSKIKDKQIYASLKRVGPRAAKMQDSMKEYNPSPLTKKERMKKWNRAYKVVKDENQTHISAINR